VHNEEFYHLYSSSDIVRVINASTRYEVYGTCGPDRRTENVYTILVGKFGGRCFKGPERKYRDNIKMNLKE
jgi:hypothetical protein